MDLDSAQALLLGLAPPRTTEQAVLLDAHGRWLAEPLIARLTQPPAAVSAMDGWAIRHTDLHMDWTIIGEASAGAPSGLRLGAGQAIRIFTGAELPDGADTVVMQEEVVAGAVSARLTGEGPTGVGAHVRRMGQDFLAGARLAEAGAYITPALIGLAAAAGHAELPVHQRPRIGIIATGNELVPAGQHPSGGQIISANTPMLMTLLGDGGAQMSDFGIVPDDLGAVTAALDHAFATQDIVVTIGGASVGDHDLIRPALIGLGVDVDFWRVAIRPGKPLLAARRGEALMVGLPGNPVSAHVCATLFLLPLLRHMLGCDQPVPRAIMATVTQSLQANGSRRDFLRAHLEDGRVTPFPVQDSSMLSVLARANALIVRPEDDGPVAAETSVPILLL